MWKENKVELGRRAATLSPLSLLPFRRVSLLAASVTLEKLTTLYVVCAEGVSPHEEEREGRERERQAGKAREDGPRAQPRRPLLDRHADPDFRRRPDLAQ